jgi:hypothetical protein
MKSLQAEVYTTVDDNILAYDGNDQRRTAN